MNLKKYIPAIIFFLLLFLIFEVSTNYSSQEIVHFLSYTGDLKSFLRTAVYILMYIFILITLLFLFLLKKGTSFYLLMTLFTLTTLIDYSYYLNGFTKGFSVHQLLVAINEKSHIFDAIQTFYFGTIKSMLVVVLLFILVYSIRKYYKKRFFYLPLFMLFVSLTSGDYVNWKLGGYSYNYPSIIKVPSIIFDAYIAGYLNTPVHKGDKVTTAIENRSEYNNIILIVDESIRGDYLSINGYKVKTTPYLDSLSNVVSLGVISSVANNSASSNYILRNGVLLSELPDKEHLTLSKPTIFSYAKNAGFVNVFADAQAYENSLQNYMSKHDLDDVDFFLTHKNEESDPIRDHTMLSKINKILQEKDKKHFVYFVKAGAHFPWQKTYPIANEVYKPALDTIEGLSFKKRKRAVNTYQNAVRWSSDDFFLDFFKRVNMKNTLVIYTSDHGQNIVENNTTITHGLALNPPSTMAAVPLLIFDNNISRIKEKMKNVNNKKFSQYQLFPTLLSTFGYSNEVVHQYGVPFWQDYNNSQYFYSGEIFSEGVLSKGYINKYNLKN